MKRREFTFVLGGIAAGFWPRRHTIIAAMAAMVLLPIEVSDAGRLSHIFKSSSKHGKSPKHVTWRKPHPVKLAALGPVALNPFALKPIATMCDPSKFRIVLDVGHTAESEGAISAPQRRRRVAAANNLHANLFLSIHHDSVPNTFLENWEFEGKKSHFSDRFSGYSVFVSRNNPDFKTSLLFAELVGKEMKAQGLQYARQYTQAVMGRYRHPLLNKETGVYSYDQLVVLRKARMPAALLEAGSIINRDEELKMDSPERRDIISSGVTAAVKEFCDPRWAILGAL